MELMIRADHDDGWVGWGVGVERVGVEPVRLGWLSGHEEAA